MENNVGTTFVGPRAQYEISSNMSQSPAINAMPKPSDLEEIQKFLGDLFQINDH